MDRKLAKQIRAHLMKRSDVDRVKFRRGEIHCYGTMPNTNATGWWFAGYVSEVALKGMSIL